MSDAEQLEYWNGPAAERWVSHQVQIDAALKHFGEHARLKLQLQLGERVLDVGCGSGDTLLSLAQDVGPSGSVVGIDPSAPLLSRAQQLTSHLPQIATIADNAATHAFEPTHDALFSRFGVMFFAEPGNAFANLRRALKPGARLAFVCWQALEENPWVYECQQAVSRLLPQPPAPPAPGCPGPFAFGESSRVCEVLMDAGFDEIAVEDLRAPIVLSESGVQSAVDFALRIGPAARLAADADSDLKRTIREHLATLMASKAQGQRVALPAAAWLVSAST